MMMFYALFVFFSLAFMLSISILLVSGLFGLPEIIFIFFVLMSMLTMSLVLTVIGSHNSLMMMYTSFLFIFLLYSFFLNWETLGTLGFSLTCPGSYDSLEGSGVFLVMYLSMEALLLISMHIFK